MVQVVSKRDEYLTNKKFLHEKLANINKEAPILAQVYSDNILPSRELIFLQS